MSSQTAHKMLDVACYISHVAIYDSGYRGEKIVLQSNDNSFIVEVASCSKRTNDCMVSNHLYSIHFLFIYFSDSSTLPSARGKSNEGLRVSTTGYKLDYVHRKPQDCTLKYDNKIHNHFYAGERLSSPRSMLRLLISLNMVHA